MTDSPITVAIVEDDERIRTLLRMLINEEDGFACEYAYADGYIAIEDFQKSVPDIIIMDVEMPRMSGIECVRQIRDFAPEVPILMLTVHDDDETLFGALTAGATGYLVKGATTEDLLEAIRDAHEGGAPMSPAIARKVVNSFKSVVKSSLTPREREVLQLLCTGDSYKDVADKLFLSKHTVRRHIRSIYEKLEVSSRAEMVQKAHKNKLM